MSGIEVRRDGAVRTWVDGVAGDAIAASDRGLAYGDGLFETMRVVHGAIPLLERHLARLADGCARLGIAPPPAIARELAEACVGVGDGVAKLVLTRGAGARGYAPPAGSRATRVLTIAPLAAWPAHHYARGIAVRLCDTRLALQPALAGMKHLNRLEQVLARAEWREAAIAEGLMLDTAGRLVAATAANVYAVVGGVLATPALDRAGVAGVARSVILDTVPVAVRDMLPGELEQADEVFVSNALRGVVPVRACGALAWRVGPVARRLMAHFAALGFHPERDR